MNHCASVHHASQGSPDAVCTSAGLSHDPIVHRSSDYQGMPITTEQTEDQLSLANFYRKPEQLNARHRMCAGPASSLPNSLLTQA